MITAHLEAARHVYGYLFMSVRQPSERALEERQGQVRDYYNFAVQQAVRTLFMDLKQQLANRREPVRAEGTFPVGRWAVTVRSDESLAGDAALPDDLVPAPTLTFQGCATSTAAMASARHLLP